MRPRRAAVRGVRAALIARLTFGKRGPHRIVVAHRLERHDSRMLSSRTTTSLVIESTRDRPVWVSTSVTRDSQREDSCGVSSGTGTIARRVPSIAATRRIMST